MRARWDAELPPFISIVRHPSLPMILGTDKLRFDAQNRREPAAASPAAAALHLCALSVNEGLRISN